jgi:hypothetical protein
LEAKYDPSQRRAFCEEKMRGRNDVAVEIDFDEFLKGCEDCGNVLAQHDANGRCPRYD